MNIIHLCHSFNKRMHDRTNLGFLIDALVGLGTAHARVEMLKCDEG